jgi:putative colanic acid biosynthesis UDP-glucose lipid carrier transferase
MPSTIRYSKYLKEINLAGDILMLNISFLATYFYTFNQVENLIISKYFELLLFFNISWILSAYLLRVQDPKRTLSFEKIVKRLLNALGLYLLFIFAFIGLKENAYIKIFVFQSYCFSSLGIVLFHLGLVIFLKYARRIGYNYRRVLIAGYGDISTELRKFFTYHPEHGYKFFGYFDDNKSTSNVRGKVDDILEFSLENNIDEIYCVLPYMDYKKIQRLIDFAEDNFIKVRIIPDFRGFPYKAVDISLYDFIPVLNVREQPLEDGFNIFLKRFFDILFTLIVSLLFLWWFIPLLALIIKIDSKGPVYFKQIRAGKDNQPFKCYKFRTMYVHKEPEHKQASKGDPRITKVGKFLRKTSLDELPQFYNVLKGEMSVIGPRPHPLKLNEHFQPQINKFMLRHTVKPGITGLAQAKGYRGETETVLKMKNRVKLDRFYAENWSLVFDLKILVLTAIHIFKGDENAY